MKTILTTVLATGLSTAAMAQQLPDDVLRVQKRLAAATDEAKKNVVLNWQTADFVSGQLVSGPPVKGAPYSAEAVNETIQSLADGNRIVQRTTAMQYRDNDGRERREETSSMGAIFITDPVANTRFTLHPESRTAEKGALPVFNVRLNGDAIYAYSVAIPPPGTTTGAATGTVPLPPAYAIQGVPPDRIAVHSPEAGIVRLSQGPGGPGGELQEFTIATAARRVAGPGSEKTEQLGKMYIEGVQADGTRTITTIPAGEIGNDRPIDIVDERWYSPELQMTVMTKHNDPRIGETNFQLKNINRSVPPPTLFEVPADYTLRGGGGGRSGAPVVVQPRK